MDFLTFWIISQNIISGGDRDSQSCGLVATICQAPLQSSTKHHLKYRIGTYQVQRELGTQLTSNDCIVPGTSEWHFCDNEEQELERKALLSVPLKKEAPCQSRQLGPVHETVDMGQDPWVDVTAPACTACVTCGTTVSPLKWN